MPMANGLAPPYDPLQMVGQPIIFFDSYANPTRTISRDVPRRAAHLIVEAFPTSPGVATIQVVDANGQAGQLTPVTDSNGLRSSISSYIKFLAKGVMERVAIQLTVQSGAWSVWGTFTEQASDRANYYDRNPLAKNNEYSQPAIGPHSAVQRWIYTVPTSKKAYLEACECSVTRDAAAAASGLVAAEVRYTPALGVAQRIIPLLFADNVVGSPHALAVSSYGFMQAGDAVSGVTTDASTGGTLNYTLGQKSTEFDA
jgi:hypothetical protein